MGNNSLLSPPPFSHFSTDSPPTEDRHTTDTQPTQLEEYKNNPGLNIDLEEELKGYVFENPKKLYESILKEKYNIKKLNSIRDKYITSTKGDITKNIAKFILKEGELYEKEN